MGKADSSFPSYWTKYRPLLDECTHADMTSAVLLSDGGVQNVFSVLTFARASGTPSGLGRLEYLTDRPETVPRTSSRLAIARSVLTITDAASALPADGRFLEPTKKTLVACRGSWADPVFVGHDVHRLRSVLPHVGSPFWVFQYVPPSDALTNTMGENGLTWTFGRIAEYLKLSFSTRHDYAGAFVVVLPEYRASIRVERGQRGRVGIEYRGDRRAIRPLAMIRSSRSDELCTSVVAELKNRYTVFEVGSSDFEEVELYDINSGMLLDRNSGHPFRGFEMSMHMGEQVTFDVELHDDQGHPSGDPIHVEASWGHVQQSGVDERADWERTQRRAAILAEQKQLYASGRLFFYQGGATEREKAIKDICGLIRLHARRRLCVWDPYFSGRDAVEFLPHVADPSIAVQILTSLKTTDGTNSLTPKLQLVEAIAALGQPRGSGPGMMNIESRHGHGFHDRFLITDVSCWQLGTSFNQIGNVYSTIVEFPYAELVLRAFELEWNRAIRLGPGQ